MTPSDDYYMEQALKEAIKAFEQEEVPIGAVIVMHDKIIARGYNQVEKLNDSTAHAEIIALTSAYNFLGSKYLPDASLYVTIEPCFMCAGALYWSKISKVVYGANDDKHGSLTTQKQICSERQKQIQIFHPKTEIISGVLNQECMQLMKKFFKARR